MRVNITAGDTTLVAPILNGPTGPAFAQSYGCFLDLTTQTNVNVGGVNWVTFDTIDGNDGMSLVDGTEITASVDGMYAVTVSAVFERTSSAGVNVDMWAAKNNVDIPMSNTRVHLAGSGSHVILAVQLLVPMLANDFVELAWTSTGSDVTMRAYTNLTNPGRPDMPSIIATVMRIAEYPGN